MGKACGCGMRRIMNFRSLATHERMMWDENCNLWDNVKSLPWRLMKSCESWKRDRGRDYVDSVPLVMRQDSSLIQNSWNGTSGIPVSLWSSWFASANPSSVYLKQRQPLPCFLRRNFWSKIDFSIEMCQSQANQFVAGQWMSTQLIAEINLIFPSSKLGRNKSFVIVTIISKTSRTKFFRTKFSSFSFVSALIFLGEKRGW